MILYNRPGSELSANITNMSFRVEIMLKIKFPWNSDQKYFWNRKHFILFFKKVWKQKLWTKNIFFEIWKSKMLKILKIDFWKSIFQNRNFLTFFFSKSKFCQNNCFSESIFFLWANVEATFAGFPSSPLYWRHAPQCALFISYYWELM